MAKTSAVLRGRISLVVGGVSPGAQAVARALACKGAIVIIVDYDEEQTGRVAEELASQGSRCRESASTRPIPPPFATPSI